MRGGDKRGGGGGMMCMCTPCGQVLPKTINDTFWIPFQETSTDTEADHEEEAEQLFCDVSSDRKIDQSINDQSQFSGLQHVQHGVLAASRIGQLHTAIGGNAQLAVHLPPTGSNHTGSSSNVPILPKLSQNGRIFINCPKG